MLRCSAACEDDETYPQWQAMRARGWKVICVACVQISERMWTLWPQLVQCFHEWAIDYFENLLVPLDNFISRGTDTFLSGQNPNYLQQAWLLLCPQPCTAVCVHNGMCSLVLLGQAAFSRTST